jgi:hypothetical protein
MVAIISRSQTCSVTNRILQQHYKQAEIWTLALHTFLYLYWAPDGLLKRDRHGMSRRQTAIFHVLMTLGKDPAQVLSRVWVLSRGENVLLHQYLFGCACTARGGRNRIFQK